MPETKRKKPPRVTPGGLRIELLLKETVRGPLGGSLLHIDARIAEGAARCSGEGREGCHWGCPEGGEHAAGRLLVEAGGTAEDEDRSGKQRSRKRRKKRGERISRPMPARAFPAQLRTLLTEHCQARLRLGFRQGVLKGENHGTVTRAPVEAARSPGCGCSL